jgi:hypothetical protein
LDSIALIVEPANSPQSLDSGASIGESSSDKHADSESMAWSSVVFSSITHFGCDKVNWVVITYLDMHLLKKTFICFVGDRSHSIELTDPSVLLTECINQHRLKRAMLINEVLPFQSISKLNPLVNLWISSLYSNIVFVYLVFEGSESSCFNSIFLTMESSGSQANDVKVNVLGVIIELLHIIEYWCVNLVYNHDPLLFIALNLGAGLVGNTLIPLHTTHVSTFNELSILLSVAFHESLCLEDNIDLVVSELEECKCNGGVNPALALPCWNDPDLVSLAINV